jgi:hypothetical protein
MKYPKGWNKMNLADQETYLVKKYQEAEDESRAIFKMLAKIRGGNKIQIKEIERPDEAQLKNA